jgi:hypothetical protein
MIKYCENCNCKYEIQTHGAGMSKFCKDCKPLIIYLQEQLYRNYNRKIKCLNCDKEFFKTGTQDKFCLECRDEIRKIQRNKYSKKHKQARKKYVQLHKI